MAPANLEDAADRCATQGAFQKEMAAQVETEFAEIDVVPAAAHGFTAPAPAVFFIRASQSSSVPNRSTARLSCA